MDRGTRSFNYFDCIRITEDVPKLYTIMQKWKDKIDDYRDEWMNGSGGWPAKLVETQFVYKGQPYHFFPDDIGLERRNSWDEGLMEWLQPKIQKDLEAVGAIDVHSFGFLD